MGAPEKLICLTIGANQGIGYEAAKSLAVSSRGPNGERYHVLLGSRDAAKGQKAVASILASPPSSTAQTQPSIAAIQLDVTDPASIQAAAALVRREHGRLDALVNNAGVLSRGGGGVVGALQADLAVNVVGAAAVTEAFLPLLLLSGRAGGGPRVVFVSSSMGSFAGAADPGSRYYRSVAGWSPLEYRVSKAALNMLMLEYWKRYGVEDRCAVGGGEGEEEEEEEEENRKVVVRVWSADPGANATNFMGPGRAEMARERGIQGPEAGARVLVGCVVGERDGLEGKVVGRDGEQPF